MRRLRPASIVESLSRAEGGAATKQPSLLKQQQRQRRARACADTSGPPANASAQCRDGSYSFSEHTRGTCSHYGGVAQWLKWNEVRR
ncbi:DUF3761 domain-containing protein [Rudaea sp.]|uniref:DUF3761 domain-containing protein n=1 Tax=Rudaea sp. TaxID=2136325 RepID=UPI003782D354